MESTEERFMPEWKGIIELEHFHRYYFVINQIDLKNKKVLDIASGEGYGSNILSRYAQSVIGVDLSNEAVVHAKNKYKCDNLQYIQGDAAKIPLEDESVDVVVSFETIEHHDKHTEMLVEIKRVLKSNGVLIMSSPDKYYFTDLPDFKNEFHVKELYYSEFRKLISSYFNRTFFFSQRTFGGSIIALDDVDNRYCKPLVIEEGGENHPFLPLYNIAIATNNLDFNIFNQIVLYSQHDQVITKYDVDYAVNAAELKLRATKTWQLGHFLIYPFKKLKWFVRKH